jgi:hypothetical protein
MDRIAPLVKAREAVEVWQQYELPVLSDKSTESERIWRDFLLEKRVAYNTLSATING